MRMNVSGYWLLALGLLQAIPILAASQVAAGGGREAGCQATAQSTFNACMKDPINHESFDKCKGDGDRSYSACLKKSAVRDTSLRDRLIKELHDGEVAEALAARRKRERERVTEILHKCESDGPWCWYLVEQDGELKCGSGAKGAPGSAGPGRFKIAPPDKYVAYDKCPKEVRDDHSAGKRGEQPSFRVAKTPPSTTVTVAPKPKVPPTPAPREAAYSPTITGEFMREILDLSERERTRESGVSGTPTPAKDFGRSPPPRESRVTGPGDGTIPDTRPRPDSGARKGPPGTDRPTGGTTGRESGISGTPERTPAPPPRDSTSTRTSDDTSTDTRRASPVADGTDGGSEPADPGPSGIRFGMQPPVGKTNDLSNIRNKVLQLRKSGS